MTTNHTPTPPRMVGKAVLVTGGTAGIGLATARQLAREGATLLVTGRDPGRGEEAVRALKVAGAPAAHFLSADHGTIQGNLDLVAQVTGKTGRLDVLVNNVGGLIPTRQVSADGTELTLALNLRPAVLLTEQLQPLLAQADAPLVINVASDAYGRFLGDPFADLGAAAGYQGFDAYARAKLLLVLATLAHARALQPAGIRVFAVNPGMAWTPGTRALTPDTVPVWRFIWPLVRFVQRRKSPDRAAHVVARLAADPDAVVGQGETGRYVTSGGTVRDLGALQRDTALQDRALALAHELAGADHGTQAKIWRAA